MKTRQQQRGEQAARLMTSVQLQCHLTNLVREILAGDASKLPEFQQFVQFAPPEMNLRILDKLEEVK